jgi:hypothetical protein
MDPKRLPKNIFLIRWVLPVLTGLKCPMVIITQGVPGYFAALNKLMLAVIECN